jgi:hypothetical protein
MLLDHQPGPGRAALHSELARPLTRGDACAGELKRQILAHFDLDLTT